MYTWKFPYPNSPLSVAGRAGCMAMPTPLAGAIAHFCHHWKHFK